jgi:hypothetical protein
MWIEDDAYLQLFPPPRHPLYDFCTSFFFFIHLYRNEEITELKPNHSTKPSFSTAPDATTLPHPRTPPINSHDPFIFPPSGSITIENHKRNRQVRKTQTEKKETDQHLMHIQYKYCSHRGEREMS